MSDRARDLINEAADRAVSRDSGGRKAVWAGLAVLTVGLVVFVAYFGTRYTDLQDHAEQQDQYLAELAQVAEDNATIASTLEDQVRSLGEQPVVDAPTPGQRGERGEKGEPGPPPSPEAIEEAVQAYCDRQDCRGPKPTPQQVAAAVSAYCDTRGQCRGPSGEDGDLGPPPSDDQVASAVTAYCVANDHCRGPAGEPGRPPTADEIVEAVDEFFANRDIYCTPPDLPSRVEGEPWRCSTNEPGE